MSRDYDHLFKLLIIGDSGKYPSECKSTIQWSGVFDERFCVMMHL